MRQINVGGILHQQHHWRGDGLFSRLLKVRLYQCCKGDIRPIQQPIHGFTLFPGLHLSRQRSLRILCQLASDLHRASRAAYIMQLDTSKGSLGPPLGIQRFLSLHPSILSRCKLWVRISHEWTGDFGAIPLKALLEYRLKQERTIYERYSFLAFSYS